MKVNEIKKTVGKIVVVRTDYIAEDGEVFHDEEECKKYEDSVLFVLSQDLKMKKIRKSECMDGGNDDEYVRVFEVPTERELEKLKRYLHLKATGGINGDFNLDNLDGDLSNLTYGCKIITFWDYDDNYCWTIGNGSIEVYYDYIKQRMEEAITRAYTDSKEE